MIDIQHIQKLQKLEGLRNQVLDAEIKIVGYQNNDNLIKILDEEYPKIFSSTKKQILVLIDGKKPLTQVDNRTKKELEFLLKGNCFLNGINPLSKTGELLPFNKILSKISKELKLLEIPTKEQPNLLDFLGA